MIRVLEAATRNHRDFESITMAENNHNQINILQNDGMAQLPQLTFSEGIVRTPDVEYQTERPYQELDEARYDRLLSRDDVAQALAKLGPGSSNMFFVIGEKNGKFKTEKKKT